MNDIGLNERIFILFGSRQNAVESRFPKEKQERAPRMNSNGIGKRGRGQIYTFDILTSSEPWAWSD
jgi:hypothetical protein